MFTCTGGSNDICHYEGNLASAWHGFIKLEKALSSGYEVDPVIQVKNMVTEDRSCAMTIDVWNVECVE